MFWILATLAVAACSITLAKSAMMIGYRRAMKRMFGETVGHLVRCPYCTSHWVAALVVAIYRPPVGGIFLADLVLAWLALVGGSAVIGGVILQLWPFSSEE